MSSSRHGHSRVKNSRSPSSPAALTWKTTSRSQLVRMLQPLQQFPTKSPTILSALKAMRNIRHSLIMASGHLPELTKHCTTYFDGNGKSSNYSSVTCYNCGKKGHISSRCTHTAMMTPGPTTSAREWMKVQPINRSAETKEVNGKTWHWCGGCSKWSTTHGIAANKFPAHHHRVHTWGGRHPGCHVHPLASTLNAASWSTGTGPSILGIDAPLFTRQ